MQGPPVENVLPVTLGRHSMDLKWTEVRIGAQSLRIPFIGSDMPRFEIHIPRDQISVLDPERGTPEDHSRLMGVTRQKKGSDVLISVEGIELWGSSPEAPPIGEPAAAVFPRDSVVILED